MAKADPDLRVENDLFGLDGEGRLSNTTFKTNSWRSWAMAGDINIDIPTVFGAGSPQQQEGHPEPGQGDG